VLRMGLLPGTPTAQCANEAHKTSKTETKARACDMSPQQCMQPAPANVRPLTCNSRRPAKYGANCNRYQTVLASAAEAATSRAAEDAETRGGRHVSARNMK
jgi:hypothetical protein